MSDRLIWGVPSFWIERFPLYYGRRLGIFAEQGIDLRIRYYWGGPELAAGVAAGEVGIGEMGLPPFLKAYADGLPAVVIGSSAIQQLDHYLVARPGIARMEDLRGRRLGILSRGSCDHYFARLMLAAAGLDPEADVELVPLGCSYGRVGCFAPQAPPGIPQVEAGFLVEPFVARAEALGWARILAAVRDYFPRYQWGIILASRSALAADRDAGLLRRALAAFRRSCRVIAEDPESAAGFGAQVFRVPKADFLRALRRDLDHWQLDARLDEEGMANCLRVQQEMSAVPAGRDLAGMVRQL